MKQIFLIIGLVGLVASCHYENPGYYKGNSYVQMYYSQDPGVDSTRVTTPSTQSNNTTTVSSSIQTDTAWFKIQAFGLVASESRKVMLEQYTVDPEEGYETPVAGVNYVPFDDPGLADYMVMPSDTCVTEIPVAVESCPFASSEPAVWVMSPLASISIYEFVVMSELKEISPSWALSFT